MEIKQDFHGIDKLESFRRSLNALIYASCNVKDYYTPEMAADELQRLSKAWRRPEDYVIVSIAEMAQRAVDARLLNHMLKFAKILNVPISEETLKKSWKKLTQDEKSKLADTAISRIEKLEKGEGIKNG